MEVKELNELLDSFNEQTDLVKNKLTDMMVIVSDERIPDEEVLKSFSTNMDILVTEYRQLKNEAQSVLTADEMPKEGSKASEYVKAISNSKSRVIKLQIENGETILQRFLKVKSLIAEYEAALSPFKVKATGVLKKLSEENINEMFMEIEALGLFLKALKIDNINGPEGFRILEEINKHYPMQVQWGLAGGQYFIDENTEIETQTESTDEQSLDEVSVEKLEIEETFQTQVTENNTQENSSKKFSKVNKRNDNSRKTEISKEIETSYVQEKMEETEEIGSIEIQTEIFTAVNRVKNCSPSASSFKKEIFKIAKNNKEIRTILPLMTNLGVLNKEQIYLFGICMDLFEESDRGRKKVEASIDALVDKGYLACFEYDRDGFEKEAFCMSPYCYGCLKKNSILVQMRGFWDLFFGDVKVVSSGEIYKSIVEKFLRNNSRMAEYLYAMKSIVEPEEYQIIKQSIRWKKDHYQVGVVKDGEMTYCKLYDPEDASDNSDEAGLLVVGEETEIYDAIKQSCKKIFIFSNQTILMLGESANMPNEVGNTVIEEVPEELFDGVLDEFVDEDKSESREHDEDVSTLVEVDNKFYSLDGDGSENEDVSIRSLLNLNTIPTDEEFCTLIGQLLNKEVTTKEQLTSLISQVVSFAKAVGDVAVKENATPINYLKSYKLSAQLRLASNLMLNECVYTSEFLSSVFVNPANEDPAIMLSAYLFAMLVPAMAFDYGLKNQTELFLDHYEDYFSNFVAFKPLFNKLMGVREVTATGFSPAFVSLLGDEAESEKFINELRISARENCNVKAPKTRMKALPPMYSACFGVGSELYECMSIISENKQNKDDVEFVEMILSEYSDEQNGERSLSSIKIENKLSKAWYAANPKNKFKLEYDARDQALRQFWVRLEIMLAWVEHINNMNNRKQDISRLKTLRADIIKLIQGLQKNSTWKNQNNANILMWALLYMQQYLNGQVVKLRIYSDFLYTGVLTVGNDGIPIIDHNLAQVKYYEPWRNVLTHIVSIKKPIADVKAEILGDNLDDKADEEGLKDNLHQLEMLGKLLGEDSDDYIITESQLKDAIDSADDRTTRFQEKLELAYTYNQINETEKENLLGIVNQYKSSFYKAKDFACWRRFLEALEKQVTEFAKERMRQLRARLDSRLKQNPESTLLVEANRLLEQEMNFAVTEEYINRFEAGETELDEDVILHDIDYFSDFLKPNNFDTLLQECRRCNGKSLSTFGWNYVERNMPNEWTSRQKEDSRNLLTNWPKRKATATSTQIKSLFTCLGFDVINANRTTIKREDVFKIEVKQTAKSMADYRHPIAAFGTQVRSPINAIMLFGNYTEKQLVDTVSSLDLGGVSIVLLDRPIDAASRRLIGEIFHTQTSGQNPFLLIDQVLILYLALHQITERMPAMLKCTMPYSTYQPFVRDGGSTADEMFCGRTQELATILDPNGACVVYGGRQLGKTALLERAESRCSKPENKAFAVYTTIIRIMEEKEVVDTIVSDINKKVDGKIELPKCNSLKDLCTALGKLFRSKQITSMLLLIDEVDDFLASIADEAYRPIQPLVDLKRETKNNFKFVIAGLHNVCRAKNATKDNGIFGQLGTPLCIKPLSPTDALQLISRPLRYLGFQIDRYPHLETILTNTNYYPGILQFFGYMLVETLTGQYAKYYHAADGNPPFTLQDEQLGAVMNSSDLNKSIKDKFRWSLELDQRYFMIARCITMLYHYYDEDRKIGTWQGFPVDEIMQMAEEYKIHCLKNESKKNYISLLDEMVEMGILGKPDEDRDLYRLRRNSFVDIIGENFDTLEADIISNNEEV